MRARRRYYLRTYVLKNKSRSIPKGPLSHNPVNASKKTEQLPILFNLYGVLP